MARPTGYAPLDNNTSDSHDDIMELVADTANAVGEIAVEDGLCPVCTDAATLHLAVVLLRKFGVSLDDVYEIVNNADRFVRETSPVDFSSTPPNTSHEQMEAH